MEEGGAAGVGGLRRMAGPSGPLEPQLVGQGHNPQRWCEECTWLSVGPHAWPARCPGKPSAALCSSNTNVVCGWLRRARSAGGAGLEGTADSWRGDVCVGRCLPRWEVRHAPHCPPSRGRPHPPSRQRERFADAAGRVGASPSHPRRAQGNRFGLCAHIHPRATSAGAHISTRTNTHTKRTFGAARPGGSEGWEKEWMSDASDASKTSTMRAAVLLLAAAAAILAMALGAPTADQITALPGWSVGPPPGTQLQLPAALVPLPSVTADPPPVQSRAHCRARNTVGIWTFLAGSTCTTGSSLARLTPAKVRAP